MAPELSFLETDHRISGTCPHPVWSCDMFSFVPCQLPYHELEKLNGIEEVKQYLHKKLLDVPR